MANNERGMVAWIDATPNCPIRSLPDRRTMRPSQYILLAISLLGWVPLQAAPTGTQIVQQMGKVFVIAMENHNLIQPSPTSSPQQLFTNSAAPYINSLMTAGNTNAAYVSYATKYYNSGVGVHPSEPNYVWAEAGTDFGIHIDSDPSASLNNFYTAPHLTAQLNTAGISWKNYQEDVQLSPGPTVSKTGTGGPSNPYYHTTQYSYAVKHNPMAFFTDTTNQNVYPLTSFTNDLANNTVGRYNWITPNLYNDQHTALSGGYTYHGTAYTSDQACIAQGDNFLSIVVPLIMASPAYKNNGVIIIRWDETEGADNTTYTIPEIVISPLAKGNAYASSLEMSHSSDIKTVEEMLGLSLLANVIPSGETKASGSGYNDVATVNDLSDLFKAVPAMSLQQPANTNLTNGVSTVNFGPAYLGSPVTNIFTVTNSGLAALTLTNITLAGVNSGDFTLSGPTLPATIATNASATFSVAFSPGAASARSASLQIVNNDFSHNPFTVTLTGTGLTNPPPVFSGAGALALNALQISFNAAVGQHYRILTSDDVSRPLTNWVVLTNGLVFASPVIYTNASLSTNAGQFFLIVSP